MIVNNLLRAAVVLASATLAAQNYDIALIGDMPYGTAGVPRFERVIADINRTGVDFTVHIGDTKSGSTRCDDSYYPQVLGWFNSFETALLYTPGDNEWTDCMRTNNGAYDPLDRLALVRKTFFTSNMSLGKRPIQVMRQSQDSQYSLYVENAMLVKGPVVFATIHAIGSNNNLQYTNVQGTPNKFYDNDKEFTARNAANIAWIRKAFQTARDTKSLGVMLMMQANLFEGFLETGTGGTRSGFEEMVKVIREETGKFPGEVVVVGGDSHYMRVDKPLTDQFPACTAATGECKPFDAALDSRGARVLNFTRVEVPGSGDIHWILCHVRPNARNIFSFEFMIVPPAAAATGVTASIVGPGTAVTEGFYETTQRQIGLDASGSTSTNSGDLTYSWATAAGYPTAAILGANSAKPQVQFDRRGDHKLDLVVTDRTGATGKSSITIRYQ